MRRTQNTLHVQAAGAPPPPYSESNTYTSSPRTGFAHLDDAASCVSFSSSGTGDHVIYTPPMTPRTSSSAHHYHNSPQQDQMLRAQYSATRYFDSRRVPATADISHRDTFIVGLNVQDSSVSGHFPFQDDLAARDVTRQDWATFMNFLLPDLTARRTQVVWEREPRAEGTSEHDATASSMTRMEPQLDTMREEEHPVAAAAARRRTIRETVQQWNEEFFGPRSIHLVLEQEFGPHVQQEVEACRTSLEAMSFDDYHSGILPPEDSKGTSTEDHKGPSMGQDQAEQQHDNTGSPDRKTDDPNSDKTFSQDTFGDPPASMGAFSWSVDGNSRWCHSDRGEDLYSANDTPHGHPGPGSIFDHRERGPHEPPHYQSRPPAHAHDEIRGRPRHSHHDEKQPRAQSTSSTASSITSSYSASSSVGSLPDYNDIQEHQLPLYAARLQDWTSHPEQRRTKRDVEALKAELKSLKTTPETVPLNQIPPVNKRALKGQIKALQAQWRGIKKTQRQSRKAHKRERRQRRRAEKQERRQNAKEVRRAYKNLRKGRAGRACPGPFGGIPAPPMPVDPQIISAMAMATATATSASSARLSQSYASRRGSVRHSQRGSYFVGPQGICGENIPMGIPGMPRPQRPLGPLGPFGPFGPFGPQGLSEVPGFAGQGHSMHSAHPSHPMHWFPHTHPMHHTHHTHPSHSMHPMHPWGPRNYDQGEHPFRARGPVPFMDTTRGSGRPHNDVPGAWPNDDIHQATGISGPAPTSAPGLVPGPASAAKYRVVANFEDQVRKMTSRLASLEDGAEKASLQKTTDELVRMTDRLRREADEVYARDLACAG
ncbi:hypothetical protein E4U16_000952 [Claviceps sp. LM84 group G4]|nr:hypothetical protein E4U16_000952 [Claviceps sp. LM84 group G4]KAG6085709.1 hypothetical protein E4U33_001388 [Claviceps sp. LM78 group G4]